MNWVIGGVIPPTGDKGSDVHQLSPDRHFDNAVDPTEICERWSGGYNTFLDQAVKDSAPARLFWTSSQTKLYDREGALEAFGEAAHALADFYSHSNWIDGAIAENQSPGLAPILHSCDSKSLPADLQTGYFHLSLENGIFLGCPKSGPPPGFHECHTHLNKDDTCSQLLSSGDSCFTVPGQPNLNYHDMAVQLATEATLQLWTEFHDRVVQTYTPETWNVDGECIFNELAYSPGHNCLDLSGLWDGGTQIFNLGAKISGALTAPFACPYGGALTSLFTSMLETPAGTGTPFGGSINVCLGGDDPSAIAACISFGVAHSIEAMTFTALVDTSSGAADLPGPWPLVITFMVTVPGYTVTVDSNGNIVSCMPDPSRDHIDSFSLLRSSQQIHSFAFCKGKVTNKNCTILKIESSIIQRKSGSSL